MQAVRLTGVGQIGCAEVARPDPGPGEILVRVEAAGICGTDRHLYKGEFPCRPPLTLGHEFAGIIEARGAGVDLPLGARVACDPNAWCGQCGPCRAGRVNLCAHNVATGVSRDGGLAQYATFPARTAHLLPGDLDPAHGALCEPLSCTLHGVDLGAPRPGERVTVIGGGVIGLLAVQLAHLAGAEVMLLTRNPAKQALGCRLGAALTAGTESEARRLWPGGAALVLECAGVADTVAMTPRLTQTGGRAVLLGVLPQGLQVGIEPFDLLLREIVLQFAFLNPFTMARAVDLIASGRIAAEPLISRRIGLEAAAQAIAAAPGPEEVKLIVLPGG